MKPVHTGVLGILTVASLLGVGAVGVGSMMAGPAPAENMGGMMGGGGMGDMHGGTMGDCDMDRMQNHTMDCDMQMDEDQCACCGGP